MGKKVESIELFSGLSITQASRLTAIARETIARYVSEAGLKPCGERHSHPIFKPSEMLACIYRGPENAVDPDGMRPFERKAHYQAEHEKLRLQVERGELVPSIEVEQEVAAIVKRFAQGLDAMPDLIERDVGVHPVLLSRIERAIDQLRESIYQDLAKEDDGADSAAEVGE